MQENDFTWVDVEHMLNTMEIRNLHRATEHEFSFSCPYPNHIGGDEKPSCYMNLHTTAFFCHGCKERGNAVTLVSYVFGVTPLQAARFLRERYLPGGIDPDQRDIVGEIEKILNYKEISIEQPELSNDFIHRYAVNWEAVEQHLDEGVVPGSLTYFLERGFSPKTLTEWEFGYDRITDRPIFPVRAFDGKLIGFKARAWHDRQKPKYLILGDKPNKGERYGFPCYFPSQVVFGANRVDMSKPLVVCEGELNAVAIRQNSNYQAVAINGSHFSEYHAEVIRRITDDAILMMDWDKAGQRATWGWEDQYGNHRPGIVDLLSDFINVRLCLHHDKDAADMSSSDLTECIDSSQGWLSISLGV